MDPILSKTEIRVLGSLIEKELTTPEYYPLSLNALTNACNQKSNRYPVVDFDEKTVVRAIAELKEKQLAWQSDASRVPKYGQNFIKKHNLITKEAAIICVLLLRGPQTPGELRGRTERIHRFASLEEMDETLRGLEDSRFLIKMARQPGMKEARYAHLLGGEPEPFETSGQAQPEAAALAVLEENQRIARLEEEVARLHEAFQKLQNDFETFKREFE